MIQFTPIRVQEIEGTAAEGSNLGASVSIEITGCQYPGRVGAIVAPERATSYSIHGRYLEVVIVNNYHIRGAVTVQVTRGHIVDLGIVIVPVPT